jgi:hypothetical protein
MSDYEGGFGCKYMKIRPCEQQYEHMPTLGTVMRTVPYPDSGPNFTVKLDDKFAKFCEEVPEAKVIYELSDYERVRARKNDVSASVKKCDKSPSFPNNACLWHAIGLVEEHLAPIMTVDIGFHDESDLNLATSAGFVYLQNGLPSKGDALESKIFEDLVHRDDFIPLASIANKDEFLCREDLGRNKVRTIFVDPLDKIVKTKEIFDKQNKRLLDSHKDMWIKYGMVKQYGGFHRLIRQLEDPKFDITDQGDISGYDRCIFLFFVYYIRWKCLRYPKIKSPRVWYVIFHSIFPCAITPNGYIIMRQTGNNSGGNDTTTDNSIGQEIVLFYFLTKQYYKVHHVYPSLDYILYWSLYFIYSDDNLGGINLRAFGWSSIDDYVQDKRAAYLEFGLEIKPSAELCTLRKIRIDPDHEFLGSFTHYNDFYGLYIPYPRIGKICSSISRRSLNGNLSESEFFEKVLALTFLSFSHDQIFKILIQYLNYLFENAASRSAYRQILYCNNLDFVYSSFLNMHTGWEGNSSHNYAFNTSFLQFFYEGTVVVDLKAAMSKVAAGKRMVNELIKERILDPMDVGYCVLSVDPFHDVPMDCNGMPDATMADQITVQAPYQLNFTAPAGTVAPWSFLVVANPWTTDVNGGGPIWGTMDLVGNWLRNRAVPAETCNSVPSVSVYRGTDGANLGPFNVTATGNQPIGVGLAAVHTEGMGRLLGYAFEIYDTSAVINKQGTCTIFRQMINFDKEPMLLLSPQAGAITGWGVVDGIKYFRPPQNVNEANQLLGTLTQKGEEGAYVVMQQSTDQNNAKMPGSAQPVILNDDFQTGLVGPVSQIVTTGGYQQIATGVTQFANIPSVRWGMVPYHMGGAFFTGLNPSATYTLRAKYIFERMPTVDESVISLYTKRASGYNPIAMEIRTRCQQKLPVGFPVNDNAFGDYFWEFISDVVPSLLGAVNPILGGLGAIGKGVLGIKGRVESKQKPIAKPVITPPPPPPMPTKNFRTRKALPVSVPFNTQIKQGAQSARSRRRANQRANKRRNGWEVVDERQYLIPRRNYNQIIPNYYK